MTNIHPKLLQAPEKPGEPTWLLDPDPDPEEIAKWYISKYYWTEWEGKEDQLDTIVAKARGKANAMMRALKQTSLMEVAMDESIIFQLMESDETQAHLIAEEIETVEELIEIKLDKAIKRSPNSGHRYETQTLVKFTLPLLKKLGVDPAHIIRIPQNFSKAKSAGYLLKQLAETYKNKPDVLKAAVENVMRDVSDPNISADDFREIVYEKRGVIREDYQPVPGAVCLVPGYELVVIWSDPAKTDALHRLLRGVVDLSVRDGASVLKDIAERISPKSHDMKRYAISVNGHGAQLVRHPEGYLLPTPEQFANKALQEVARNKFYIGMQLETVGMAMVPVHTLNANIPASEVPEWLQYRMQLSRPGGLEILDFLTPAFDKAYPLPGEIQMIYPKHLYNTSLSWFDEQLNIVVEIYPPVSE